jgi:coenzyme F420 biosynthesis associated uncharacterized protein
MVQLVDWDIAASTAAALGKAGPRVSLEEATAAVAELRRLTDDAAEHVYRCTELRAPQAPPVRVVDRRAWAAANVDGLRRVVNPLAEKLSAGKRTGAAVAAVGSRVTGAQTGLVLAYLSGRVLGQYEVFSGEPGQLLLVAPNIVDAERRLAVGPRDFRLWVCLHEVTHRTQFTAVPWLRGHFLAEVRALVDASAADADELGDRLRRAVSTLAEAARGHNPHASILDLVQTPAQKAVLDRLTALMTLLEGHAEYVMDAVGPDVVPSLAQIREKFTRRREEANPLERLIRKAIGVDVKLRQYAEGRRFVTAAVEAVGMAGFNRVWTSPETLPCLDELTDPQAWIRRVGAASPTAG